MCIHSRFLSRPPLDEIVVCGETIVPCISAVNLGVTVFDECMTGELQVMQHKMQIVLLSLKKSVFY